MRRSLRNHAFTLIELLVVVAIIALLLSILLPSLSGAREQGKKAKCLSNLANIGKACHQYANEDRKELVIPIHMNMVRATDYWIGRTVNWFAWGGRSGQEIFQAGTNYFLSEETKVGGQRMPEYDARRRPLNITMLGSVEKGDRAKLDYFACPSDRGYPESDSIDDSPPENANRPCYSTLGNSYRASLSCYLDTSSFAFATGPWGHRLSTLPDLSRLVLIGEPTFFNMIHRDSGEGGGNVEDPVVVAGWHKRELMDSVLFCDSSARATKVEKRHNWDTNTISQMGLQGNDAGMLERYSTFRLDIYPTGGARIWGSMAEIMSRLSWSDYSLWPARNYQDNMEAP